MEVCDHILQKKMIKRVFPNPFQKVKPFERGGTSWANFAGPTRFGTLKMTPSASKALPEIEDEPTMTPKSPKIKKKA